MNATRREALRKVGLAASLITIPAVAGTVINNRAEAAVRADRALFEAIDDWRRAGEAYRNCGDVDDDTLDELCARDSAAAVKILDTVPATLAGLRALCEFGAEMMETERVIGSTLGDYYPRGTPDDCGPDAEILFITAILRAARTLLPGEGL